MYKGLAKRSENSCIKHKGEKNTRQKRRSTLFGPEDIIQSDSRLVVHAGFPLLGSSLGRLLQLITLLYLVGPHERLQGHFGALNQHAPPYRVLPPQGTVDLLQCTCLHHRLQLVGYVGSSGKVRVLIW